MAEGVYKVFRDETAKLLSPEARIRVVRATFDAHQYVLRALHRIGDWKAAVKRSLQKKKPESGWPE
jgi:hypothetical protein